MASDLVRSYDNRRWDKNQTYLSDAKSNPLTMKNENAVPSHNTPQLVEMPIFNYYQIHDYKKANNIKRLRQIVNKKNVVNDVLENIAGMQQSNLTIIENASQSPYAQTVELKEIFEKKKRNRNGGNLSKLKDTGIYTDPLSKISRNVSK